MASQDDLQTPRKRRRKAPASTGSHVLRPLLEDIPLSTEEHTSKVRISCVELWEENLYVGTSAAEILHYVAIPPDPADASSSPSYIFASRLQPTFNQASMTTQTDPGVQQIQILSRVAKACVLCNGTLTFYSLPELSPALANTVVRGCSWIGGVNLNIGQEQEEDGQVVMVCIQKRIRLVRIRDEAQRIRNIEYSGCLTTARRDNFACVADAQSYALLDVENQQKITLFPISSLDENATGGKVEDISAASDQSRPTSSVGDSRGHGRSTSLGTFVSGLGRRSPQSRSQERSDQDTPEPGIQSASPFRPLDRPRSGSLAGEVDTRLSVSDKPLPAPPEKSGNSTAPASASTRLTPHICSPTAGEFLLTTGTSPEEPGVGIFVNLDGDVVRGTLQFDKYPTSIVIDEDSEPGTNLADTNSQSGGFILASTIHPKEQGDREVIEIHQWDIASDGNTGYLEIPYPFEEDNAEDAESVLGHTKLRTVNSRVSVPFPEVGDKLHAVRLRLRNHKDNLTSEGSVEMLEGKRNEEEQAFGRRLGSQSSQITVWSGSSIWWVVRNPLALRLDGAVEQVMNPILENAKATINRNEIIRIVNETRDQEAATETDFLSLEYIRQKTSVILFADAALRLPSSSSIATADWHIMEGLLMDGGVDPRVILTLIPLLREEVIEGPNGIWIHAGLIWIVEYYSTRLSATATSNDAHGVLNNDGTLSLIRRYLGTWRQRKGFGSVADEVEVFQSVDAALLHLLLYADRQHSRRSSIPSAARAELYTVVDNGVDCFERAISLLEEYRRLYILSRLYQNRKMAGKVLETWRRILNGAEDEFGELRDGENEVRKYLAKIRDVSLIHEYGTWLARRNPELGIQVFADDASRVKFVPQEVVKLLETKAPDAVKVYLEHLVFGKKHVQYANNLISYYLDSVLQVLGSSREARETLSQSYESYRALEAPKPTYRQFIIDNAVSVSWWQDRLRLLELLGGSHGADFSYDLSSILARLEPFEQYLVPESIILDGRQGRHQQALRLLTHGLGDYHTAINYCLMGGASIFHPISGSLTPNASSTKEDQAVLFGYLLTEFLRIEDASNRLQRTSELLERFGSWYDVRQVLDLIPSSWSVELVSGFLVSAFRRLVHDKNDTMIAKALSGAENLQVAAEFVEKCTSSGPQIEELQ